MRIYIFTFFLCALERFSSSQPLGLLYSFPGSGHFLPTLSPGLSFFSRLISSVLSAAGWQAPFTALDVSQSSSCDFSLCKVVQTRWTQAQSETSGKWGIGQAPTQIPHGFVSAITAGSFFR